MLNLKFRLFLTSLLAIGFLSACNSKQGDRNKDGFVENPISVGTKIEFTADNITSYLYFYGDIANSDRWIEISKPSCIDINVGFDVDVTFYYKTTYTTSYEDDHNHIYSECYSYKVVNFKSTKLDESVFSQNKEFIYTFNVLENTFDIECVTSSSTIYKVEYNFRNIDGYGIFNEKCYGLYGIKLDMTNYFNYFSISVEKIVISENEQSFLCYSIYLRSSDDPNSPLFLTDLNIELEYAVLNSDYTIKSTSKDTLSSPFINHYSSSLVKPLLNADNDEHWTIKVNSISGISYVKSIHIFD